MQRNRLKNQLNRLCEAPIFSLFCAALLCGLPAGAITALYAEQGDGALRLIALSGRMRLPLALLMAALWPALAMLLCRLRPAALSLGLLLAFRGYLLSLSVAVSLVRGDAIWLSLCLIALPALFHLSALLLLCTALYEAQQSAGRRRDPLASLYALCFALCLASALLRALLLTFLGGAA